MDMPFHSNHDIVLTSELLYLRFHGRNENTWWSGDTISRYDYQYSTDELNLWSDDIKKAATKVKSLRIYFNNHAKGKAVKNARELQGILQSKIT